MFPALHLKVLQEILNWAEDQAEYPNTTEVRLNFTTGDMEVYDYESGIVHSKRPLAYFTATM